jgi:hypothetical protein
MNRMCKWTAAAVCGVTGLVAQGQALTENFDSYAPGSTIVGQDGWELWHTGGVDATVTNTRAHSAPNSLNLVPGSDIVHRFNITSGAWTIRAWTFVPADATGDAYMIALNQYSPNPDNWSIQVRFGGTDGVVESQFENSQLPLIRDRWVEFRAEVDLTADTLNIFYDNAPLSTNQVYSTHMGATGIPVIAAIDLYDDSMPNFFYDDVSVQPAGAGCRVDLNGDNNVNVQDFLMFLQLFSSGDARADFTGDNQVNIQDFLSFLQAFAAGC